MRKQYWNDKRVLITGSEGFIGQHLLKLFQSNGVRVRGISRSASVSRDQVDVTNYVALAAYMKAYTPDVCYHLAGGATVEEGQEKPYQTFHTNIVGTINMLELSRTSGVSRIIVASTSHVYGTAAPPTREEEPPRPSRPYETSKTATDIIAQSYADSYDLPVLIPRLANVYGPGDPHTTRIIPKTIHAVLSGNDPAMWGGRARREYLYIDDAINALVRLAQIPDSQMEKNRIFNFGTGEPIAVSTLMKKIIALSGERVTIRKESSSRTDEIPLQRMSWSKAKRILSWTPQTPLDEGLEKTIAWYKRHPISLSS